MRLYCKGGVVVAAHPDGDLVPAALYGESVTVLPFAGAEVPQAGDPAPAVALPDLKEWLRREIDDAAERVRLALITPGAGQAMEYGEAQAQAAAALKAPTSASADKYPMLAASVAIDLDPQTGQPATDVLGVARSIQAARDLWLVIGAEIRGARLAAKKAVDEASTVEAARAAAAGAAWPTLPHG